MKPFHFRKFSLNHHTSTMKVGTDANILSVWCDLDGIENGLDVGTGSGVIAMVVASRSYAKIDAIEIDEDSAIEAGINFRNSPYSDRLSLIHEDFKNYSVSSKKRYDLIISNPPFFSNFPLSNKKVNRNKARHTLDLNHDQLIEGTVKLLNSNGRFCVVIPYDIHYKLVRRSEELGLYLHKQLLIHPRPESEPNRINMEFRFGKTRDVISNDFYVRTKEGLFTTQYKDFFKDTLTDFLF